MSDDIARVVMLWPADLKAEIQKEVGKRGLTAYVLDAVREKRGRPQAAPQPVETPVQSAPPPAAGLCKVCGTELADGLCWVCG